VLTLGPFTQDLLEIIVEEGAFGGGEVETKFGLVENKISLFFRMFLDNLAEPGNGLLEIGRGGV